MQQTDSSRSGPPADGPGPVLSLSHAAKTFGPVVALADGTIDIRAGEIHALIGENGAGKSTLVKILAGLHHPDSGDFRVGGESVEFRNVADSKAAGIAVIYQEPTLFPDLSVAENIFMGRQPTGRSAHRSPARMRQAAAELFDRLGVPHRPRPPGRGPVDRRPADRRDRQGASRSTPGC